MEYSEQFQQEKENEIKKIEKQNQFVEKLQQANLPFLSSEENTKLNEIYDKNNKFHHKLKNNEFEIAIFGEEKAGKSTLGNALIENNIFVSTPTFTFNPIRLSYGDDKAIVEFYTEEEFNNLFIELLKTIEYPDAEKQHFRNISLEEFEKYFNNLEKNNLFLYKTNISTYIDIKEIIEVRDKLKLDGSIIEFFDDEIFSEEFRNYIDSYGGIEKALSVKRVEIYSSKMKRLTNSIIYDIPGFEILKTIKEKEVLKILKKVDVIIFVKSMYNNPSFKIYELNILKNSDNNGIPLKNKFFIFGNKIDIANSKECAKRSIEILKYDIETHNKIIDKKRVFTGSALKYLMDKNIIETEKDRFHYDFNSEIDNLYNELINYYENERFENLKKEIEINKFELKRIFDRIKKNNDIQINIDFL
jgi:GTPase Era involved in 16S rRNA processing